MMDKTPFSMYDFFSYLSSGFILIIAFDYISSIEYVWGKELSWPSIIVVIIASYVIGHINSHFSSWILERKIVGIIGSPTRTLLNKQEKSVFLFKDFINPLHPGIIKQIKSKYIKNTKNKELGEEVFLFCYHMVKENSVVAHTRLQSFMNVYGFSRNMSMALLIVSIGFIFKGFILYQISNFLIALSLIAGSFVLFLRFLKFYKHYAMEVFLSYICLPAK